MTGLIDKLTSNKSLCAIREGLLWTVPFLIVNAVLLLLASFSHLLPIPAAIGTLLSDMHQGLTAAMPMLIGSAIGYMLSILYRLPQLPVAFLCAACILIGKHLLDSMPGAQETLLMFLAIILPLAAVPLLAKLYRWQWTHFVRQSVISSNIRDVLNIILPGVLTTAIVTAALALLVHTPVFEAAGSLPARLASQLDPLFIGPLLAALNSLLWFFGINGYYALLPMFEASNAAFAAVAASPGINQPILHTGVMGAFVFIGGCGASLSLIVAILLSRQDRSLRLLALAAIPIALLNVNEILLFGIPLILNPRLFLPFILVPVVNALLTIGALSLGLLPLPDGPLLPFFSPILFNAYVTLGGHISGTLFQILLIGIGAAIYAPFLVSMQRQHLKDTTIHIQSLDATFTQLQEESLLYTHDPVLKINSEYARHLEGQAHIREISHYSFFLEFQPLVSLSSGRCVSCEALLRARSPDGQIQAPVAFLEWLAQAGLMRDVDLWVARHALHQHLEWKTAGFTLPISINITSDTLTSPRHFRQLLQILSSAKGMISVELTEAMLVGDADALRQAFERLHAIGAKIYIDDFGTGYSTLSRLHQFDVDAIKIDRSFVLSQHTAKGRTVLMGILRLATALGLQIIVEGVETTQQLIALQAADIDDIAVQGWYYSKALPAADMPEYVRSLDCAVRENRQ